MLSGAGKGDVLALGDPQAPQGFNPVTSSVIWPGEHLNVVCDFDSSMNTAAVTAGPTHAHEMCNMYLMVYSAIPHIEMCNDGTGLADERSPGNMFRAAVLLPDPFPLWKPPKPQDDINGVSWNIMVVVAIMAFAMPRQSEKKCSSAAAPETTTVISHVQRLHLIAHRTC